MGLLRYRCHTGWVRGSGILTADTLSITTPISKLLLLRLRLDMTLDTAGHPVVHGSQVTRTLSPISTGSTHQPRHARTPPIRGRRGDMMMPRGLVYGLRNGGAGRSTMEELSMPDDASPVMMGRRY